MWWTTLWVLWVVVILVLTTMPWSNYVGHSHWDQVRWIPFWNRPLALSDIFGNVLLFIPFGYLQGRVLRSMPEKSVWIRPMVMALTVSTAVECFQVYCHNRTASTTDISTNLLGTVLGIWLSKQHI